ncbi:MAG: hypothetical protein JKY95_00265 [Planctomycetaceae bacterium]|nr:hypothetical protein [Planctomycetaceae bacterium]
MMQRFLLLLPFILPSISSAQDDCDTCEFDEIPGVGTVTVSYSKRSFLDSDCGLTLCETIFLDGTIETDGVETYAGIVVDVDGFRTLNDDVCCSFLTDSAPIPIAGVIIGRSPNSDGLASATISWGGVGSPDPPTITFLEGGGSCSSFSKTETVTHGGGYMTIETVTVSFSGGNCEPIDPDPDDDPDPPGPGDVDPRDSPDIPDLPDDDDDPDDPDPDDDPDDPDPPVPGDDDYPDDPPTDDECCIAIVSRLDLLVRWAADSGQQLHNINSHVRSIDIQLGRYAFDLMYDENAFLRVIVTQGAELAVYLERFDEYLHDSTFYLQALYERFYEVDDGGDTDPPDDVDEYQFQSGTSAIVSLKAKTEAEMVEHNQLFHLPDISAFEDEEAPAPIWDWSIPLPMVENTMDVYVDFSPMQPIRDLVKYALMILASLHSFHLVMRVLKK